MTEPTTTFNDLIRSRRDDEQAAKRARIFPPSEADTTDEPEGNDAA